MYVTTSKNWEDTSMKSRADPVAENGNFTVLSAKVYLEHDAT